MFQDPLYQSDELNEILRLMKEAKCSQLYINYQEPILLNLCVPKFTKLKELDLRKNKLLTIEFLSLADFESIKYVSLNDNLITSTQPLNKTKWSKLKLLTVRKNMFTTIKIDRMTIETSGFAFGLDHSDTKTLFN